MKKENILVVAIVCIAVAGVFMYNNSKSGSMTGFFPSKVSGKAELSGQNGDGSNIAWQDYNQGMAMAKTQGKHVFLYFHADWCTYCRKLKKTTFKDEAVLSYLRDNFISIAVDTDKNQKLSTQWKVKGLPTLWFLEPDNSKISSIPGYVEKKQFLNILKYIHTKSYSKMTFNEFVKTL
ncbi:thioredoxin family protein [Desulfobacula toluolica]|nr:thioredoxin fold domain-containing protein [Desulfobacula toluolica]